MTTAVNLKMTYAEYLALEQRTGEKHEFQDGEAWPLWPPEDGATAMAGGTFAHAELAAAVIGLLRGLARGGQCRVFSSDLKVRVEATGLATYADAAVVCGRIESSPLDRNAATNPTVIVEVLSDSTEAYDRGEKFRNYQRIPSLRAYVLVSQHEQRIEVFVRDGEKWTPGKAIEGGSVTVPPLGELSVAAVYDGVTLTV